MGHYKGKREAQHSDNIKQGQSVEPRKQEQPVSMGDPFQEERRTPGEWLEDFFDDTAWFFRSPKGKILSAVFCGLIVLGIFGYVGAKQWIKPPELPTPGTQQSGENTPTSPDGQPSAGHQGEGNTPVQPESDEDKLYPDDGYSGDMPELSGARKEGVYTFLLVGTDKDDGNTDTIMVASYDTVKQTVNVMSIPRDTMINESWDIKKINSVYARTGSSISALSNRIKKLVGFKPDFYVKVDLSMFVELVDLVGGVEFDVPQDMNYKDPYQDLYINLKKGVQTLDGDKAMQLVRFRGYADGDIGRVKVQQDFLKALVKECLSLKHWGKIKAYIDLALDNVETDLDFGSVVWFASNVMGLNKAPMLDMSNVNTCTIPGDYWTYAWSRSVNSNQSYVTIYANQTVKLVNESFNPYVQNVTTGMLDIMTILKNGDIASSTGVVKDTKHNEVMAVQRGEAYYDANGKIVYGKPAQGTQKPTEEEPTLPPVSTGTGNGNGTTGTGNNTGTGNQTGTGNNTGAGNNPDTGSSSGTETEPPIGSDITGEEPVAPPSEQPPVEETPKDPSTPGESETPTTPETPSVPENPPAPELPTEEPDSEMPEWLRPKE